MSSSQAPPKESFVDVLIIGAGPAGVMCANALQQAGVRVRIVDKTASERTAGHADGCQPRTMEILQSYGLLDSLLKRSEPIHRAAFYVTGEDGAIKRASRSPAINAGTTRYDYKVLTHQGSMEAVLIESMREKGLQVERCTEPSSMATSMSAVDQKDPHAYVVKVILDHSGGSEVTQEVVHAKFVLGSDGAHSWVRKNIGIRMDGDATNSVWGVIDLEADTDFPDIRNQTFVHSDEGVLFIVPRENDLNRLYIQQPESDLLDPATGRVDKDRTSPEKILDEARKILSPYKLEVKNGRVDWWTVYTVGQRVAMRFSAFDRVFIAGDACHTHTPKAGQGLNASMGDTHNLAWKIIYVLRGWADMPLLGTYEAERRTYAKALIDFDKKWSKLFDKPRTEVNQEGVPHDEFMAMYKEFGAFTSGVGIHYGPSVLVSRARQVCASNVTIGMRMPPQMFVRASDARPVELQDLLPADTRFKILVFGGDVTVPEDLARLEATAEEFAREDGFLERFGRGKMCRPGSWKVFDLLCFSSAKLDAVNHTDFPEFFRPHHSKVLVDDKDQHRRTGGGGYSKFGIDAHNGAIIVVRPDGYVGMVAPLDQVDVVDAYFAAFLLPTPW